MSDDKEGKDSEIVPSPDYLIREKRIKEAFALKKPDRIPIMLFPGYLLADMGGITRQELYENPEKTQEILEEIALYFKPDSIFGLLDSPEPSKALGDRMTKWPGSFSAIFCKMSLSSGFSGFSGITFGEMPASLARVLVRLLIAYLQS